MVLRLATRRASRRFLTVLFLLLELAGLAVAVVGATEAQRSGSGVSVASFVFPMAAATVFALFCWLEELRERRRAVLSPRRLVEYSCFGRESVWFRDVRKASWQKGKILLWIDLTRPRRLEIRFSGYPDVQKLALIQVLRSNIPLAAQHAWADFCADDAFLLIRRLRDGVFQPLANEIVITRQHQDLFYGGFLVMVLSIMAPLHWWLPAPQSLIAVPTVVGVSLVSILWWMVRSTTPVRGRITRKLTVQDLALLGGLFLWIGVTTALCKWVDHLGGTEGVKKLLGVVLLALAIVLLGLLERVGRSKRIAERDTSMKAALAAWSEVEQGSPFQGDGGLARKRLPRPCDAPDG